MANMCNAITNNATCCLNRGKFLKNGLFFCGIHNKISNDECPICMMNISNKYLKRTICGHKFHCKCLTRWMKTTNNNNTCPICRRSLNKIEIPHNNNNNGLNVTDYNWFVMNHEPIYVGIESINRLSLFYHTHNNNELEEPLLLTTPLIWKHVFNISF